jgi:hypothetical protein
MQVILFSFILCRFSGFWCKFMALSSPQFHSIFLWQIFTTWVVIGVFFLVGILVCSQSSGYYPSENVEKSGYHPKEDLAKSGYKTKYEIQIFQSSSHIFWLHTGITTFLYFHAFDDQKPQK